jgi:hypothetical protein
MDWARLDGCLDDSGSKGKFTRITVPYYFISLRGLDRHRLATVHTGVRDLFPAL